MPRKRLDVLLDLFTEVSAVRPELRLVQVGPSWTTERSRQITRLRIGERLVKLTGLGRPQLAELYRNAAAVLVPSEAEGFGLPVIEALACGAIVIASDIPVLREVGGNAVIYSPVAAIDRWTSTINSVLNQPHLAPSRNSRLQQAAKYSWREHARIISEAYLRLK
jgi:glycosyltransferase involved in cell wall biosynthesis